jgi:predicted acyl esterase
VARPESGVDTLRSRRIVTSGLAGLATIGLMLVPAGLDPGGIAAASSSSIQGRGSVDEAWLTGAAPGDRVTLLHNGAPVPVPTNPGTADSLGALIIRGLAPGGGYSWDDTTSGQTTGPFPVLGPGHNPSSDAPLYTGQPLHAGLNYITMRDGIQLAATVRYPFGVTCTAAAPCPTVIEYSGYNVAGPTDPIPYLLAQFLGQPCTGCGDPHLLPDSATYVGAVVARFSGFATVSLQMRGTGCSGGAYDLFGYPSDYDAYDAVEVVAHQGWVAHHKVGMVGISYSGLSQFPSAGTAPPDLAAVASMSPTDDLFSTGYPGGVYNSGFAASWVSDRIADAKPAATLTAGHLAPLASTPVAGVGQPWTYYEIDDELAASGGASSACLADQALHGQSETLQTLVGPQLVAPGSGPGRLPSLFDRRSMSQWAAHIDIPVFVSGALQDDETGPQWPALLAALPTSTPVYANLVNGGHIDSADPQIMSRWLEFLDIFVARQVPKDPGSVADLVLDSFASTAAGTTAQAPLPRFRFTSAPDPAAARSDFESGTPRVRVLFDSGAGPVGAGDPQATYAAGFTAWPPTGTVHQYFLGPDGRLSLRAPAHAGNASLVLDPSVRPETSLPPGANPWAANPPWNWTPVPAANGIAFQTAPFQSDTTVVGPASLDLWLKSAAPVVDLQVTVTEVRPAASEEEYVTSGFLRSSDQIDLPTSTELVTYPSYLGAEARNLSPSSFRLVRVPIDPIAHTFRAGTELRIVVSAPGGDRPSWVFDTLDQGQTATVGIGGLAASALVFDQVAGVAATPTLPGCGSLRGEPCRAYQIEGNQ